MVENLAAARFSSKALPESMYQQEATMYVHQSQVWDRQERKGEAYRGVSRSQTVHC